MCKGGRSTVQWKTVQGNDAWLYVNTKEGIYKMKKLKRMFLDKIVLGAPHTNPL